MAKRMQTAEVRTKRKKRLDPIDGEKVVTTMMSPGRQHSTAAWIIRLSPAWHSTVTALPAMRAPRWIGRISGRSRPCGRPIASCTVDTPSAANPAITSAPARSMFRTITWRMAETLPSDPV